MKESPADAVLDNICLKKFTGYGYANKVKVQTL